MDVLERKSTIKRDARREERIEEEKVGNLQRTEVIHGFIGSHGKATTTILIYMVKMAMMTTIVTITYNHNYYNYHNHQHMMRERKEYYSGPDRTSRFSHVSSSFRQLHLHYTFNISISSIGIIVIINQSQLRKTFVITFHFIITKYFIFTHCSQI